MNDHIERPVFAHAEPSDHARKFFTNPSYADSWTHKIHTEKYEEVYRGRFLEGLRVNKGDLILEIGVGEGRNAREVISQGAKYVGLDISRAMLEKAKKRIPEEFLPRIDLIVGDAVSLPFKPASFDRSFSFGTIFFVPNQNQAIEQMISSSRIRVGIEFRNAHNPRVYLYAKTASLLNRSSPILRTLNRTKYFRKVLPLILGRARATKFLDQIETYDSIQPVFGITTGQIRDQTQKNGWSVESLESYSMTTSEIRTVGRGMQGNSGGHLFAPVLIVQAINPHQENR